LEYKKPNIKYKGHVGNYLKPFFGTTRINRINFDAIERFIAFCNQKGVIAPTLKKFLVTLEQILKYATRKRYIDHNPIREIERPKDQREKKEIDFLRPDEIRALLENTPDQKYRTLFLLAVMTGMRQGELLGLKWTDIDWFNRKIYVRRTFNHGRFFEPKSRTSKRAIDMTPTVISELKKWKLACPHNELDLVFPNENGKPINSQNMVKRQFLPAIRRAGLREIHFHCLRHTYASLLIAQGEHPKYIQAQMGHSSVNVTMGVYGHLIESVNIEASRRLDKAVFGATEKEEKEGLNQGQI